MRWSSERVDDAINVGTFAILVAGTLVTIAFPNRLTVAAFIAVTACYVLMAQLRDWLQKQ